MKNKWKWIYNPFEFVAGWKAFGIGVVILCLTTIVGYFGSMVFYGAGAKTVPNITWGMAFSLQFLGLSVTVVVMYLGALFFAKNVRFQDILGTVTLSKYPLLLMALLNFPIGKKMAEFGKEVMEMNVSELANMKFTFTFSDLAPLLIFSFFSIILMIWLITLLFNAFRVSTNLKGVKCVVLFISTIFISEIITSVLVYFLY